MRQVPWTRRRIFWTLGVGLGGLVIGGKGGGVWGTFLGSIWGAGIGYGLGSIFDQEHCTKRVVAYWAVTLMLAGPFFGLLIGAGLQPNPSVAQQTMAGAIGAAAGALLGLLVGTVQLRRLRRRSKNPDAGVITDQRQA